MFLKGIEGGFNVRYELCKITGLAARLRWIFVLQRNVNLFIHKDNYILSRIPFVIFKMGFQKSNMKMGLPRYKTTKPGCYISK